MSDSQFTPSPTPPSPFGGWRALAAVMGVGLLVAFGFLFVQHSDLVNSKIEMQGLEKELAAVRESVKSTQAGTNQALEVMRQDLDTSKKETESRVDQVRYATKKQTEAIASQVTETFNQSVQDQQAQQKKLSERLEELRDTTEKTTSRLSDITGQMGSVKSDVNSTRSELEKTVAELKRVTGDLGLLSGLIATNSKEIQALRDLGEKDYFEFKLPKSSTPQRVADVQVLLKKVDQKKARYSLEILTDDKRVEKKDKGINEPVQFYVQAKSKQPYELVVNTVGKNEVIGYLATPKVKLPPRS